jgi:hypothetical protein
LCRTDFGEKSSPTSPKSGSSVIGGQFE